jgi:hypothetical protein
MLGLFLVTAMVHLGRNKWVWGGVRVLRGRSERDVKCGFTAMVTGRSNDPWLGSE